MTVDNLVTIFLLLLAVTNLARGDEGSGCSWGGPVPIMKCRAIGGESTYTFFIQVNDTSTTTASGNTIDAEITFDWGESSYTTTESLETGKLYNFSSTHKYATGGYFLVGYDVAFSLEGECNDGNVTTGNSALLRVDRYSCDYGVTTNAPTITPSPTETPSDVPTISSSATKIARTPILAFLIAIAMLGT